MTLKLKAFTLAVLVWSALRGLAQPTYEPYTFMTLAGRAGFGGSADGKGSAAQFGGPAYPWGGPQGVAVDGAGNAYVADTANFTIRKVTPSGDVTTLAGLAGNSGSTDGTGSSAWFRSPFGVAVDSKGEVYVADSTTIRKVTSAGVVTTLAGGSYGSANGTGRAARFAGARSVAVDSSGNVFVADTGNYTIRKMTPVGTNWVVTTVAGQAGSPGKADGVGRAARFGTSAFGGGPSGLAVDSADNIYVADKGNQTIRKMMLVGTNWVVTTLAIQAGIGGVVDPIGVAVDGAGNIYVADLYGGAIRKVTPTGVVTTLAGFAGYSGSVDGTGSDARFAGPSGVAVDSAGNVYVAESGGLTIRKGLLAIGPPVFLTQPQSQTGVEGIWSGDVVFSSVANGTPPLAYQWFKDGAIIAGATNSRYTLQRPVENLDAGLYHVVASNLYGAETSSSAVLTVTPPYAFLTLAGSNFLGGSADGMGSAAQFNYPGGVAVDSAGNIYVADTFNNAIRKVTPAGEVTTLAGRAQVDLAGNPLVGAEDGIGTDARFNNPRSIAVDNDGNVFVADTGNRTIRKVTPTGEVTTLAGLPNQNPSTGQRDGTGSAARFEQLLGIAVDRAGNLFVSDRTIIRKVTPVGTNWVVTTLAGLAGSTGSADGTGNAARFYIPQGIAVDSAGNLYVADTFNNAIRKVTPVGTNWVVTTLAGVAGSREGRADGTGNTARFKMPQGIAVDSAGNLYVADQGNSAIRKVTPGGTVTTLAFQYSPSGLAVDSAGNIYVADGRQTISKGFPPAGPPVIFTEPEDLSVERNPDASFTFRIVANGVAPLAYQWRKDGVDIIGATNRSYGLPNIQATDAGVYSVLVTNTLGSVTSSNAVLRTFVRPPEITFQPLDRSVAVGYDFKPGFGAAGTQPLRFQWRKDGADIAGATNADFSIINVQNIDVAVYSVVVSNAYGAVTSSNAALMLTFPYTFTTLAGKSGLPGSTDGTGKSAQFAAPRGLAVDKAGNIYVADAENKTIRMLTPNGVVTTLAGLAGRDGSVDGMGSRARFYSLTHAAVDSAGNIYAGDFPTIRKVTPVGTNWVVTTLAGRAGIEGSTDGTGSAALFIGPSLGLAVDGASNVYVADSGNHTIRKVTSMGVVTTLAGMAGMGGSADGTGSDARFYFPSAVAVDSAGNVYVGDSGNHTIRKMTPVGTNWVVTTLAGLAQRGGMYGDPVSGFSDGTGSAAQFKYPGGVAVDDAGNVYVADVYNNAIRKVTPAGVVTTLGGLTRDFDSGNDVDGMGSGAQFERPSGIAVDSAGNLYVADTDMGTIRKGFPTFLILKSESGFGFNGSKFGFQPAGPLGQPVVIEASRNLIDWQPIWTNTFAPAHFFEDDQSAQNPLRFYRTRLP